MNKFPRNPEYSSTQNHRIGPAQKTSDYTKGKENLAEKKPTGDTKKGFLQKLDEKLSEWGL